MTNDKRSITILVADDDAEDRLLINEALAENQMGGDLHFVEDGEELMDYLYRRGKYTVLSDSPLPGLILLDLNMPRKDGREALEEIKSYPLLRQIPIIIMTTSKAKEDVYRSYDLGANSFIQKPATFEGLIQVMKSLSSYWLETVELPPETIGN